jgi:hypothetical protein
MRQEDNSYANEGALSLIDFINKLFDFARRENKVGMYIEMEDGHHTRVDIIHIDDKVIIKMDDLEMGYFEEMDQRGYKCAFHQKYRPHIKDGLLPNELLMKAICNHPLVLFYEA